MTDEPAFGCVELARQQIDMSAIQLSSDSHAYRSKGRSRVFQPIVKKKISKIVFIVSNIDINALSWGAVGAAASQLLE